MGPHTIGVMTWRVPCWSQTTRTVAKSSSSQLVLSYLNESVRGPARRTVNEMAMSFCVIVIVIVSLCWGVYAAEAAAAAAAAAAATTTTTTTLRSHFGSSCHYGSTQHFVCRVLLGLWGLGTMESVMCFFPGKLGEHQCR